MRRKDIRRTEESKHTPYFAGHLYSSIVFIELNKLDEPYFCVVSGLKITKSFVRSLRICKGVRPNQLQIKRIERKNAGAEYQLRLMVLDFGFASDHWIFDSLFQ